MVFDHDKSDIEKCIIQYNKDSKVVPIHNIECRNTIIQYIKQNFNHLFV